MKSAFLLFLLFLLHPFQANARIETTEVIYEVSVKAGEKGAFALDQKTISKALREGLVEAARMLSSDKLNANILGHYESIQDPLKKGYVHGYSLLTKDYDVNSDLYTVVLKILYFSAPIKKDIASFGLHVSASNAKADNDATFLFSVRLLEGNEEKVIHLSNIISDVFELKGAGGSLLVKGDTTFLDERDLHAKYPTKRIVMVNLSFARTAENNQEIRGILSYKVLNKSDEILKAMSFTENIEVAQEDQLDEQIHTLARGLVEKMLKSYSGED